MPRKTVKLIAIDGIVGGVVGSSVIDGRSTTNGEVGAYGDPIFTTSCAPVLHAADFTVDILDEGGQYAAIKALIGRTVPVTVTVSYSDNAGGSDTSVQALTGNCAVLDAKGDDVAVDSDGRSVIHVTLRKQPDPASTNSTQSNG